MTPNFSRAVAAESPFPHVSIPAILGADISAELLSWLRSDAPWRLRQESFYEQYEFGLLDLCELPDLLRSLTRNTFVAALIDFLVVAVGAPPSLSLVGVSAHKLVPGQTIKVHNDFIDGKETHRVLIQLNDGWDIDKGGILMLFADDQPESVASALMPVNGSGFAFEISPRSYHAVSTIKSGERFTLVYTFRS